MIRKKIQCDERKKVKIDIKLMTNNKREREKVYIG